MSERDRVRTTYNVYGRRKKAVCEEAIAAAKAHPEVDTTSEAVAEMARGYLAHVGERGDGHEPMGVDVPPEAVTVANALLAAAGDEDVDGGAEALVNIARSYTGWDAHEATDGGGLHERHEEDHMDGEERGAESAEVDTPATDGGRPMGPDSSASSKPRCSNCGQRVSRQYVRTFAADEAEGVQACPQCPDRVRTVNGVREARSTRHNIEGASPDFSRTDATKE